jgi:hypothetical protein
MDGAGETFLPGGILAARSRASDNGDKRRSWMLAACNVADWRGIGVHSVLFIQTEIIGRDTMPKGGRRAGAGRPSGSGWTSAVSGMRVAAAEQLVSVVGSETDPLRIVLAIAADPTADVQIRLGAASIALPYLYPRLSATTVNATNTNINVDAASLLDRLDERISRLGKTEPPPVIEAVPDDDADARAGGDASPDKPP